LLSELLRQEEVQLDPEPAVDHNGLGLMDMFSSSLWVVHSLMRDTITGI